MAAFLSRLVERPVLAFMVAMTILVLGGIAYFKTPITMLPDGVANNRINMWIPIQNMTPQEAEDQVYAPLEGLVMTIPGVTKVIGRCSTRGVRVFVQLSKKLDPKFASAEVRDRIQRARASWPSQTDRWFLWRETSETLPLMFMSIGIPSDEQRYYDLIDNDIKPGLERIEGVGEVSLFGSVAESIRIFFDRQKFKQFQLNFREILQALQDDNQAVPVGEIQEGNREYVVRADMQYRDLDSILDLPIAGGRLKIRDVARVERVRSLRNSVARVDGKIAVHGMIRKISGANAVETSRRIRKFFDDLAAKRRFEGIRAIFDFDKGELIEDSLGTLTQSSFVGAGLAFLVLLAFLRRIGMTSIITLSLPLSLLVAIVVLFFRGDTLNLLSMASLTMAIGMLVDNSVVVLENIFRLRQKGLPWIRSCVEGVQGVGNAVALATLTTVAVFLPIAFMGEGASSAALTTAISLPLCIALLGSLFVALVLLPASIAFLHRKDATDQRREAAVLASLQRGQRGLIGWLTERQVSVLRFALRHRVLSFVGIVLLIAGMSGYISSAWKIDLAGTTGSNRATVTWKFPRGTTLSEANRISSTMERFLIAKKDDPSWHIRRTSARFDRREGRITVNLRRGATQEDLDLLVKRLRTELPKNAGIEAEVWARGSSGGEDAEEGERGFSLLLSGRDSSFLRDWSLDLKDRLLERGLAENVDLGNSGDQEELRLNVDRARMQELGVDPRVLLAFVNSGLTGQRVSRFREKDGRETDVIAEFDEVKDMELKDLEEMQIWSNTTGFQRLGDLSTHEFTKGYDVIRRENGVLTTTIAGSRPKGLTMTDFSLGLAKIIEGQNVPRGFTYSFGGRFGDQRRDQKELMQALLLGMVLVFLVMGLLFESIILPIAVFGTVPFAMLGGLTGLFATGHKFEMMVILGLMILGGVIVNNGIVLLDHIERLRKEGMRREEAILQGVRDRLRPILMTATTTIVGLLPMGFMGAEATNGFDYKNMSIVVASGLFLGTFMTPFVVSYGYTFVDDFSQMLRQAFRRAIGNKGQGRGELDVELGAALIEAGSSASSGPKPPTGPDLIPDS